MKLTDIKELEDLNEELEDLEKKIADELKTRRQNERSILKEKAFSSFKEFFEKQGFIVKNNDGVSGNVKSLIAVYKKSSISIILNKEDLMIGGRINIGPVEIKENPPKGTRTTFIASGNSKHENELSIIKQKISAAKHALDNINEYRFVYFDFQSKKEYTSFTDLLSSYL